jgi:uncharacterized protein YcbK (DUF882 family)
MRPHYDRRGFLSAATALLVSARAAYGAVAAPSGPRSISLVHTHTQQTLEIVYFQDGAYLPDALASVAHVLRDFRTGDIHPIDPALLDFLVDLRKLGGFDEPYQVISGYRSPQTNAQLRRRSSGVAEHSLHMEGRAIDVRIGSVPTQRLHELALRMQRGGVGFYPASDFVHLDTGRVRSW